MSTTRKSFDPLQSLFGQPSPVGNDLANDPPDPANIEAPPRPASVVPAPPLSAPIPPPAPPVAAPPAAAAPAAPDPREIAKAIAKAATARAGASRPSAPQAGATASKAPPSAPAAKAPPAPAAKAAAPVAPARAAEGGLRGAPPPPARKLSAAEAMDAARRTEAGDQARAVAAAAPVVAAPRAPSPRPAAPTAPAAPAAAPPPLALTAANLGDAAQALLNQQLPGWTTYVASAMLARDRVLLGALWKAHRTRFVAAAQAEAAVGAAAVIHALSRVAVGELAAVQAVTDGGEFLVWVDLRERCVIAAFANGAALMAGLSG